MAGFENRILLRLKREFSKDEKLKFIVEKLSKAELEIGFLKSEATEAQDVIAKLREEINKLKLDKDSIRIQNAKSIGKLREQTRMVIFWRDKYLSLKAKQNNEQF